MNSFVVFLVVVIMSLMHNLVNFSDMHVVYVFLHVRVSENLRFQF